MKSINLIGASLIIGILIGCSSSASTDKTYQINEHRDEKLPDNLSEIIGNSDVIVKGTYNELIRTENMIRSANDPTVPSDDFYTEGLIYDFTINKTYKGDVIDSIKTSVTHLDELPIMEDDGEVVGEVTVEVIDYEEIDENKEYVLFLVDGSYIEEGLYTPASEIYIIEINNNSLQFLSKRIEGNLYEAIELEENGDDVSHAVLTTEYREDISVDIVQEFDLVKDYLGAEDIDTLNKLEEYLE
ncbi:hypothetical protein AJ85_18330 [Alkalihalobacillus alcalophilus ATCC 27647 = CGMCC 1.3604]|uniref:Lipoprotein n=1 Tax=Alkalihalobacillus alcalophilus ATCC 27647 = CGMCC 1.3604 TaxID=1218173 RepID=A0A094XBJ3_ALKAL|nr:hypothetical protein [Alkalihalobacillus alcalophilus]KGA96175.1 hypothetical protein BALCAV_0217770 [Alkalihalobacillus alcalophilus ATCC 27647 = CGMCC 1.3604]MED1560584.1 hypothetical protein [Alkalihalobacillus alcalophilus]THG92058.1 hypothetical protein AJ85_18330 [Alkalihalobacillus alcalophilus ATCC 27647 = CGMCC 1.3604]